MEAYQDQGHLKAHLDPLIKSPSSNLPDYVLNPRRFGLVDDGGHDFELGGILPGFTQAKGSLTEVVDYLKTVYCGTMTIQAAHIQVSLYDSLYNSFTFRILTVGRRSFNSVLTFS